MGDPTTTALLAAWEIGLSELAVDRAPSLLRSLTLDGDERDPADMTVGECDRLLVQLRRRMFGAEIDAVTRCPHCREYLELHLSLVEPPFAHLQPTLGPSPPQSVTIEEQGYLVEARVPLNRDLRYLAGLEDGAELVDLLERCVVSAKRHDGSGVEAHDLPPEVAHALVVELADQDPGAEVGLLVKCPCGMEWTDVFDIRAVLWDELTAWAHGMLGAVHQLASCYGWSERSILEMHPWRRQFYLEASAP